MVTSENQPVEQSMPDASTASYWLWLGVMLLLLVLGREATRPLTAGLPQPPAAAPAVHFNPNQPTTSQSGFSPSLVSQ